MQQRLEQLIQNGPLAPVQIDLTINGVQDGDDLTLLIHSRYSDTQLPDGGAEGSRTPDLFNAIEALSQLSYSPIVAIRRRISWPPEAQTRRPNPYAERRAEYVFQLYSSDHAALRRLHGRQVGGFRNRRETLEWIDNIYAQLWRALVRSPAANGVDHYNERHT